MNYFIEFNKWDQDAQSKYWLTLGFLTALSYNSETGSLIENKTNERLVFSLSQRGLKRFRMLNRIHNILEKAKYSQELKPKTAKGGIRAGQGRPLKHPWNSIEVNGHFQVLTVNASSLTSWANKRFSPKRFVSHVEYEKNKKIGYKIERVE